MPKLSTRKPLALLPVLLPLALLMSCGQDRPRLALPPADRAAPVAVPAVPAGNSDAEVATLIADYDAALNAANAKLLWLRDWIVTAGNR